MNKSILAVLQHASQTLALAGVADAPRDARLLMAFVLGFEQHQIALHLNSILDASQEAAFTAAIIKRTKRIPMSYILGYRDFFEHRFLLTPDVLDPRPETEQLVSRALCEDFDTILDLGTGSGCILLSLLAKRPLAHGMGVDQSAEAIAVAKLNAEQLHLTERADLRVSNWFSNISDTRFDLIVSNPPYIHPSCMVELSAEVLHEPELALTDNKDGLSHYRHIAQHAHKFLAKEGRLIFEIGFDQGDAVSEILAQWCFCDIVVSHDLNHYPRVVSCRMSGFYTN